MFYLQCDLQLLPEHKNDHRSIIPVGGRFCSYKAAAGVMPVLSPASSVSAFPRSQHQKTCILFR